MKKIILVLICWLIIPSLPMVVFGTSEIKQQTPIQWRGTQEARGGYHGPHGGYHRGHGVRYYEHNIYRPGCVPH